MCVGYGTALVLKISDDALDLVLELGKAAIGLGKCDPRRSYCRVW
jgi:hypothetical protein